MALNVGTVFGSVHTDCTERRLFEQPWARLAKEAFIIDGARSLRCVVVFPW